MRLTRSGVETIAKKILAEYPFRHEVDYWLDTDAAQREEIQRLKEKCFELEA